MKILNKFENHRIQKNLSDVDPFFMLSIFAAWNEECMHKFISMFLKFRTCSSGLVWNASEGEGTAWVSTLPMAEKMSLLQPLV